MFLVNPYQSYINEKEATGEVLETIRLEIYENSVMMSLFFPGMLCTGQVWYQQSKKMDMPVLI